MIDETEYLREYDSLRTKPSPIKEELDYSLWQYQNFALRKRKIQKHLEEGFDLFSEMVTRLIKSGVMNRLFG